MKRPKSVLVDTELFVDMYIYAVRHAEPGDLQYDRISAGVRQKVKEMMRHDLYTLYKVGASSEIRKKARKDYLDAIGLLDDFRWDDDMDDTISRAPV